MRLLTFAVMFCTWAEPAWADQRAAHLAEATELSQKVDKLYDQGKFKEALPLGERALALREAELGPRHPETGKSLRLLGELLRVTGDAARAEQLLVRAVGIFEAQKGKYRVELGDALNGLGALYLRQGPFEKAEPIIRRAIAVRQAARGPNHPDVATAISNLAALYVAMGDYVRAAPLFQRAVEIDERASGPDNPDFASSLSNLAVVYSRLGQYDQSEVLERRALAIREKALGPDHPNVSTSLNNLALLYGRMGDYGRAEELYRRALSIREKSFGPDHPSVATTLNGLASMYKRQGNYGRAEELYRRAVAIREKALGPKHPELATALNNLAVLYSEMGDPKRAEPLHQRALAIREAAHHPELAITLGNLAALYAGRGDFARAEPLYRRAVEVTESRLGPDHPDLATPLAGLGLLELEQGKPERAAATLARMLEVSEKLLRAVRMVTTESRMAAFLAQERQREEAIYTLLARHITHPGAQRLALAAALLRKGRSVDEAADTSQAVRQALPAREQEPFERLRALHSRLATMTLSGAGKLERDQYLDSLRGLREQAEQLEQELAQKSAPLRAQHDLPGPSQVIDRVAAALPTDGALIEVVAFRPVSVKKGASPSGVRYLALVLTHDAKAGAADLGPGAAIDQAVGQFLAALRRPESDPDAPGRALERLVMAPLRPLLGQRTKVFLSLDGQLNLVPFAALRDDQGYLADRYALTYVTSGRDLLRTGAGVKKSHTVLVLADPAFAAAPRVPTPAGAGLASSRRDRGLRLGELAPLPGTRQEAEAIGRLLPGARVLTGSAASEPALLSASAPGILHVATHGLFMEDVASGRAGTRGVQLASDAGEAPAQNPLLRAALVLAGAEVWAQDGAGARAADAPDGLATALEMAGMNLWGTQLVVLSACDTGRGEVQLGQGVYGLRRAVLTAGAETLVTSLWRVDDQATRDLMVRFYSNLLGGSGRSEAMRQAALAVRAQHPHPYYWAPFLVIGRPGPVEGLRPRR